MSVLQTGVYANPDTPLWLSAQSGPGPGPNPSNLVVSTMTVNQTGGIIMTADNTPWPYTLGSAPIAFNRITGQAATELQMTPSKNVPKIGVSVETTYLASVTNGGTLYDDIAVEGLQIYGNQLTNPLANFRCAGYLTRNLFDPLGVELRTNTFYTGRISTFLIDADIVRVADELYGNVAVFSTLTVSSSAGSIGNNIVVSTIQAQSGAISTFNALTVAAPVVNTQTLSASTITSEIGNFSTINVSTFALPNALTISSLTASTVNTSLMTASTLSVSSFTLPSVLTFSTINSSTLNAGLGTFSTLAVSSFTLPSVLTFSTLNTSTINSGIGTFSTINASTINTGVISSLVGNFSTLIAPGGTTTPIVSSIITVAKELLTSTMTFNTTLSPKLDLGLGGIVGGLIGGVTANAMGVGLGAAGLATGATALILARQSGTGLNPAQFQTVNGTTQLQFSTLGVGAPNYSKFLTTDSAAPLTTPGNLSTTQTLTVPFKTWAVRSVSDPLNLPNAAGGTGKAIQSFGEWVNPFPGAWSMAPSTIFNNFNANYMDFGDIDNPSVGQPRITFGNTVQPEVGFVVEVKGQFGVTQGISALQLTASEGIGASYAYLSSIRAFQSPNTGLSTLNVIPGITTSTLQVSSMVANMMSTNRAAVINDLTVGTNITSGALLTVGTNLFVTNNANVTNNVTTSNVNLQSINGLPYNVANIGMPVGSLMMWPGGSGLTGPTNVPGGYLYCDGSTYSVGAPYVALYAAIGNTWGGTPGVSFRVPDSRGRAAFGSVVDTSSGSGFAYSPQVTFQSVTVNGAPVADTNNGWYVTATTGQVYVGMTFNFAGATGTRTITKILSNNGVGDGWTVPFVVLWSSTGTANAFPVFAGSSVAALQTESTTTIAPFIGRQPSDPGATYNLQAQLGSPGQGQAIDQTSAHIHTYNLGNGRSYNVAGAPDLIANNNGQNTSVPQGLYSYNIPGGGGVSANHIMLTNPPNFGVFYYIKY